MAEDAIADVVMAAATFFEIFKDEEQEEQHRRPTRRHRQGASGYTTSFMFAYCVALKNNQCFKKCVTFTYRHDGVEPVLQIVYKVYEIKLWFTLGRYHVTHCRRPLSYNYY